MSAYLLGELRLIAEQPTMEEWRARLASRSRVDFGESTEAVAHH